MALALMRRHRRWLYIFLWLVIAAFIILYIPAFQDRGQGTPGETVVSVGGLPVSVGEFQQSYNRLRQRYSQIYQGRLDENMLRQMGLEEQVLEGLVTDRLVELEAKRLGVSVSDEAVARAIATSPDFQDGGRFIGTDEIRRRLDLKGQTEEDFEHSLRHDLQRRSLESLIGTAVTVSDAEVEREFRRRSEQVKLEYVLADAARFKAAVQPTEDEIKARFEAKKDAYRIPEKRVVSYVLLDRAALQPQVAVADRDVELYYQDHREEFRQEEEACASHILVKVKTAEAPQGHPEEEAKTIAQGLLDQVKAGADFAALAKAKSEDVGSASNGGNLGCFPPGQQTPQLDDAVFSMQPGQVSDLVKTSFGYHVIRLASKREATILPLAQVKERIRATVTDRKVRDLAEQKSQALAEALGKGRSLEEAAKAQGLAVQKSAPFARGEIPPILASPTLVARVFDLKAGQTEKERFALAQGAAFVSLLEIQPARAPELKDVHDKVRADLVDEKALEQARAAAEAVKAKAQTIGLEKAAAAASLVRKETPALIGRGQALGDLGTGGALEEAAFSLPEKTLSEPVRTPAGWAVLRVLEKKPFDAAEFAKQKAQVAAALQEQKQRELFQAFVVEARERYEVTRNARAYRRALGQEQ
ncbi:MAG TPA: SurA N-terminal domain-containing protein [Vicinamibacteria bacterium]|nr:SurA N-terminal domain-containing protein [Vicinamibacteria bacterium]